MAITNYSELKTAVTDWLDRSDLASKVGTFIVLAESEIARTLRKVVVRAAITLDSNEVALPADCAELRSLRFNTSDRQYPINITTDVGLASLRRSGSGVPNAAAVVDGVLLLDVVPDTPYTAEITYYGKLVPLSDAAPSNSTLTDSPDIYLFATLKEAELFLEHDERNIVWTSKLEKAVNDENVARERAELAAAPTVQRLPVVFG